MKIQESKIRKLIKEVLEKYDLGSERFKNTTAKPVEKDIEIEKTKYNFDLNDPKILNAAQQAITQAFSQRMT